MVQADNAGNPYIMHLLRVMLSLDKKDELIVGVLHDVVEDYEIDPPMLTIISSMYF